MLNIFTLNWQAKQKIHELHESLQKSLEGLEYRWFIKDNASTDGSIEEIESWQDPNVVLFKYPHNKDNYSQGMNYLLYQANPKSTDLVLTLNNDVVINDPQSIKNMIEIINNDSSVGLVGAKLNYKNTDMIQHCGVLFHPSNGLPFHYRAGQKETLYDQTDREFPVITGAVALTKMSVINECIEKDTLFKDFLNPKFNWAFEDVCFAMRVKYILNKKVVCCGRTSIFHEESASLKKNPVNKLFQNDNMRLFTDLYSKYLDRTLVNTYTKDPKYGIYKK